MMDLEEKKRKDITKDLLDKDHNSRTTIFRLKNCIVDTKIPNKIKKVQYNF
jgi:hypothetical protein